jgi:hypothetical protein
VFCDVPFSVSVPLTPPRHAVTEAGASRLCAGPWPELYEALHFSLEHLACGWVRRAGRETCHCRGLEPGALVAGVTL